MDTIDKHFTNIKKEIGEVPIGYLDNFGLLKNKFNEYEIYMNDKILIITQKEKLKFCKQCYYERLVEVYKRK